MKSSFSCVIQDSIGGFIGFSLKHGDPSQAVILLCGLPITAIEVLPLKQLPQRSGSLSPVGTQSSVTLQPSVRVMEVAYESEI